MPKFSKINPLEGVKKFLGSTSYLPVNEIVVDLESINYYLEGLDFFQYYLHNSNMAMPTRESEKEAMEYLQGIYWGMRLQLIEALKVPIINVVIGEGASGGALGIGVGDMIICFENTWYSVISPEGCATILFRDSSRASEAADSMKVTAKDLLELGIADSILPEPDGGTHINYEESAATLKQSILALMEDLCAIDPEIRILNRIKKYEKMGRWSDG